MKISERQVQTMENIRLENAWKHNAPMLKELEGRFNVKLPEAISEMVKELGSRIDRIIPITYAAAYERFPKDAKEGKALLKVVKTDSKSGFPTAFLYAPELEQGVTEEAEKRARLSNLNRLNELRLRCGLEANEEFTDFVLKTLPAALPASIYIDGSSIRILALANTGDVIYGDKDANLFAVAHQRDGIEMLTIYDAAMDYVGAFSRRLQNKLKIAVETADNIANALDHDVYYTVRGFVDHDAQHHAELMAHLLRVNEGDEVVDYCQGNVQVVLGPASKKLMLDIDDELPSVVLVGNTLNVYMPATPKN